MQSLVFQMESIAELKTIKKPRCGALGFVLPFLVILIIYIIDWGFLKSEITKYPVWYISEFGWGTLNETVYKVSADRQEVIGHMPGLLVDRYTDCAVVDRKDWSCTYDDKSGRFGFNEGRFWDDDEKNNDWRFVSRPVYLYYEWKSRVL